MAERHGMEGIIIACSRQAKQSLSWAAARQQHQQQDKLGSTNLHDHHELHGMPGISHQPATAVRSNATNDPNTPTASHCASPPSSWAPVAVASAAAGRSGHTRTEAWGARGSGVSAVQDQESSASHYRLQLCGGTGPLHQLHEHCECSGP